MPHGTGDEAVVGAEGEPFPMPKRDKYRGKRNKQGDPHGRGKMELANGDKYDGEWIDGEMSGRGTHKWASGALYEGEWVDGVREGRGFYAFTPRGSTTYEGEFKADKRNGTGVYTWSSGEKYEGGFVDDRRHGPGKFVWSSERTDVCLFEAGRMVGEGVRWSANRLVAWRTKDGEEVEKIPIETAQQLEDSIFPTEPE